MDNHSLKRLLFTAVTVVFVCAACGTSSKEETNVPLEELVSIPDSVVVYEGFGVVRSINPGRTSIVIRHDRIDDFMSAMTMPFPLADSNLASTVQPDDSVRFELSARGPIVEIIAIETIE
ncbi:MAG: copper-binding protein [Rhodothermales bacterium]|nr:copper-binding protein [Rhodothermales bacterium]